MPSEFATTSSIEIHSNSMKSITPKASRKFSVNRTAPYHANAISSGYRSINSSNIPSSRFEPSESNANPNTTTNLNDQAGSPIVPFEQSSEDDNQVHIIHK